MKNGQAIGCILASLLIAIATLQIVAVVSMAQPQPQQPAVERVTVFTDQAFGWRSATKPGTAPIDVINATIDQMQYEQGTALGSDSNARALIEIMRAKAILEGRATETAEGFPIIE